MRATSGCRVPAITLFTATIATGLCLLAALPGALAQSQTSISRTRPDGAANRAAWMAEGSFGVMTHYLPQPPEGTPAERQSWLDRTVEAFDLAAYLRQFDETGADWLIFPLIQNNGALICANPVVGPKSSLLTSRRDLIMEIARQLQQRRKRLILYLPSDNEGSIKSRAGVQSEDYRTWYLSLVRSYSVKLGRLHHGWWFDSCSALPDEQWQRWLEACRAGNPQSAVAFSGAEFCTGGPVEPRCALEDYHAGEIHLLDGGRIRRDFMVPGGKFFLNSEGVMHWEKNDSAPTYHMPSAQYVGNVQSHCLLPIDQTFNPAIPNRMCRYPDSELFGFVDAVKSVGGAVTINVPINTANGWIPADSHAQLVRLGRHLGK